ncbi:MAG: hypothetical protein ACYTFY_13740 [Planctomycetota bacterium]|jgi:phosphoribosylformylglycinamidine (FGAM) synthase-like amidotransferase family enzyme
MSQTKPLKVGLYINDKNATIDRFVRCLRLWNMEFTSVWRNEIASIKPDDFDVLLLHGGWYGIDRVPGQEQHKFKTTKTLKAQGDAVRNFVKRGGGVVGVCCGCYNVVWLGLIEAEMSRMAGVGMHAIEMQSEKHPIVKNAFTKTKGRSDRKWNSLPVMRMSGPMVFPKDKSAILASYDWEGRLGAIVASDYGKGRAVGISPHPERLQDDAGKDMIDGELLPVAKVLYNSLYWAASRKIPSGYASL